MRASGTRVELVWMRPHDHIGWAFDDPGQFAAVAEGFLAEGRELGERLVFVAPDPAEEAYARLVSSFVPQDLQVASLAEVYGPSGVVDAAQQRATFAETLAQALADGYTGIRVAADNTTLVQTPERLAAWVNWELVADRFMAENKVTGLCGFSRPSVDIDTLRHLVTLHPVSSSKDPLPQFRLFVDDDCLRLEGDVNDFALMHLERALQLVPRATRAMVDATRAHIHDANVAERLNQIGRTGVLVTT